MMNLCMPLLQGKIYPTRYIDEDGSLLKITPYVPLFQASGTFDEFSSVFFGIDSANKRVVVGGGSVRSNGGWYNRWDAPSSTSYFWYNKEKNRLYGKINQNVNETASADKPYYQITAGDYPLYSVYNPKLMDTQYMVKNYEMSDLINSSNWSLKVASPLGNPLNQSHPMSIYNRAVFSNNGVPFDALTKQHIESIRRAFNGKKFLFWLNITLEQDSGIYGGFDNKSAELGWPKDYYTPSGSKGGSFTGVHIHAWHQDMGGWGYFDMYVFEKEAFENGSNKVELVK